MVLNLQKKLQNDITKLMKIRKSIEKLTFVKLEKMI